MWPFSKQKENLASQFEAVFLPDAFPATSAKATAIPDPYLALLLTKWGGTSFNCGIYRLLCSNELPTWTAIAESAFPEFTGRGPQQHTHFCCGTCGGIPPIANSRGIGI
jgi:hypothetical protein